MQDSLDIPEIAFQIIHYLLVDGLTHLSDDERIAQLKLRRRTLCNLAQTSKLWSHYANQEIWKHLDSLFPLLRIFSGLQQRPSGADNCSYYLLLPIMPEELETVKRYAGYVRTISLVSKGPTQVHNSVYSSFELAFRGTVLFPNLVSLEVDWYTPSAYFDNEFLQILLNETLDRVTYRVEKSSDTGYLRTIRKRAPHLTTLGIKTSGLTGTTTNFYASLMSFRNLRKLELVLPLVSLANFRAPTSLVELEIQVMYRWDEPRNIAELDFSTLTALRKLKLLGRPELISRILPKFSSAALTDLSLVIKGYADSQSDDKWFSFMRCISIAWRHTLEIFSLEDNSGDPNVRYSDFRLLKPLLQCHCLRSLYFRSHIRNILPDDSDIETMAEAWPLIETLHILGENQVITYRQRTRASFKALEHLATGCRSLASLCIPVKLSLSDVQDNILPISQSRLDHFHTDGIIIADEPSTSFIANHLVSLFPNCELIKQDYRSPELKELEDFIEYWRSVKGHEDGSFAT